MKKENLMKYLSRILCLVMMVSLAACGDDDDDDNDDDTPTEPLLGVYDFTSATLNQEITIKNFPQVNANGDTTGVADTTFPAGAPATALVSGAIVGAAPCDDTANAAIELREDGTAFYVCTPEDIEEQQGVWTVTDDRSSFSLFVNSVKFNVELTPFELSGNTLSGTAVIPLVADALMPTGATNIQTVSMEIVFTKK